MSVLYISFKKLNYHFLLPRFEIIIYSIIILYNTIYIVTHITLRYIF